MKLNQWHAEQKRTNKQDDPLNRPLRTREFWSRIEKWRTKRIWDEGEWEFYGVEKADGDQTVWEGGRRRRRRRRRQGIFLVYCCFPFGLGFPFLSCFIYPLFFSFFFLVFIYNLVRYTNNNDNKCFIIFLKSQIIDKILELFIGVIL